jgi:ABC-type Mn2+/Zn2+ transport system permease subunit
MQEVGRLLGSTLITATSLVVVLLAILLVVTTGLSLKFRGPVLLWVTAPTTARAQGVGTGRLSYGFYALTGLTLGIAMYAGGLTYTFACLVLPLIIARSVARRATTLIWLSPLIGLAGAMATTIVAHGADLPIGPVYAVSMSTLAIMALPARLLRAWPAP